ncbi:MAG: hypothetical protein M1422_02865 [Candidatus Thermoplasmatota archaeon]|nr:hypothetical protein [Candidatus Sysuiplasma jiujiangense]MBX8639076.1 hypothetical protein [Candidatus Sysuiplasma jiujiangense]MCL4317197.1 hypothetical protein [Candidatus Thermoplasmatota archaeon]MCL5254353.1 hypothetical protein [Candidatus Thermoplasmatota archaeon]
MDKAAALATVAAFAIPGLVMASLVSGWYIAIFAAVAAATSMLRLHRHRSAATVLGFSALLVFIGLRPGNLMTEIVGAFLVLVIASLDNLPEKENSVGSSMQNRGGAERFFLFQLTGLFIVSTAVAMASEILSFQIGVSIDTLLLVVPVVGFAMLLIIFAAEGIRRESG